MDDDATGPASPLPAEVPVDLRRLVDRASRIRGFRYLDRDRVEVLMADDGNDAKRWIIDLPARIRGRWVTSVAELVELEIEHAIQWGDVAE